MWERLDSIDRQAFLAVNGAHAPWADPIMWSVSDMITWFPLYAFFLFLLQRRYDWRGLLWCLPVIALIESGEHVDDPLGREDPADRRPEGPALGWINIDRREIDIGREVLPRDAHAEMHVVMRDRIFVMGTDDFRLLLKRRLARGFAS